MPPTRIPFDSLCLAAVVAECQPLVGASVQRIVQPDETTLVLELYHRKLSRLLVCWHPEFARAHLTEGRRKGLVPLPGLCEVARKSLLNGRVLYLRQRDHDRILDIGFTSPEGDSRLVAEIMGKHSKVMLLESSGRIIACGKQVERSQSVRPVRVGIPYDPPPVGKAPRPVLSDPAGGSGGLGGVSPFLGRLVASGTPIEKVREVMGGGPCSPVYVQGSGAYPLDTSAVGLVGSLVSSISAGLDLAFEERILADALAQVKRSLSTQLLRVLDARSAALQGLEAAALAAERAPETQRLAELVLAYQGQIEQGSQELKAWDYEGNEVRIPIDPEISPVENANRLFNKARHAKERASEIVAQRSRIQYEHDEVASMLQDLEAASTLDEAKPIQERAAARRWLNRPAPAQKKEDRPFGGFSIRELVSPAGYRVLYGTNATSNDYLTTKLAKGNDIWLHVRGQNSAHVLLCTQGSPEKVQMPDLLFAAMVAVKNSPAKHASHVPVDYTLKKHVRKPRGSAPGLAVYEREKTLHVDP